MAHLIVLQPSKWWDIDLFAASWRTSSLCVYEGRGSIYIYSSSNFVCFNVITLQLLHSCT